MLVNPQPPSIPTTANHTGNSVTTCVPAGDLAQTPHNAPTGKDRRQITLFSYAATFLRKEFGLEAARIILGHRSAVITEVYAEMDQQKVLEAKKRKRPR